MKLVITKEQLALMATHRPDKNHMKECISGHKTVRNRKKYSRKTKHKNSLY